MDADPRIRPTDPAETPTTGDPPCTLDGAASPGSPAPENAPIPGTRPAPPAIALGFMAAMAVLVIGMSALVLKPDTGAVSGLLPSWRAPLAAIRAALAIIADPPQETAAETNPAGIRFCAGVAARDRTSLIDGFDWMRRTRDGRRLLAQLDHRDVCVGVANLSFHAGYASLAQSNDGDWSGSAVMIDVDSVRAGEPDVLGAILVHEATHVDRAIQGTHCFYSASCTLLPNGIRLEEEVAAHAAEARWWIEIYGKDGKEDTSGRDYGVNAMAAAYREGPAAFRKWVVAERSDPRDGAIN